MSLNVEDLLKALDNENNTGVAGLTTSKIKKEKNDILQKLQLSGQELKDLHARLKDYRYINELNDIQMGRYIRWIPLNTETAEIKLTNGAFIVNTFLNEDGACLLNLHPPPLPLPPHHPPLPFRSFHIVHHMSPSPVSTYMTTMVQLSPFVP